ncbi:membrane protein insertase YidC [Actinokineospora terrae]|uniref:Membrane protein insertase YidC n=1 Tax=Actinokineospora terrae TaxID=155974 RepID=A0A1H9XQ14_9PSEU|nr:membrane protein insertase YidC [Actinokineospora terrae]SES48232.1 YidC/Oxa1 family membrane protein insertase [Actinokineospora terrae]
MLDFIYYPVSFIMWCWHWVFGHVFGESSAIAWALSIVFLVFTLRAIMFKPTVKQVRSMRKMQEFAPEIKKLQKKYANDRQKQAQEMQKLQAEHGVSPLGGCLPMLLQIPVFIGLFHVLREFKPGKTENYFFDERGVSSYIDADLFGARLSNWITQPATELAKFGVDRTTVVLVAIPLMLLASALTHLTARHSVSRQNPDAATTQTAMMNKLTLYVFPLGVLVGGFFFPIGLIMYWLSNNGWTLWQQRFVYKKIDAEEATKKAVAQEKRAAAAPKPGQKPTQPRKRPVTPTAPATSEDGAPEAATEAKPDTAKPTQAAADGDKGGTQIPGLISDRSRSKKSGRKNR